MSKINAKIDLSGADAVRKIRDGFAALEKSERTRIRRAFRRARGRVLTLYGAEAAAKLAADFKLKRPALRKLRLFRNTAKGRVWVGGNAMPASRYAPRQEAAGARLEKFGVIHGAFILRTRGGADGPVFAPEGTALPGWAAFSGAAWRPRRGNGRVLRRVAVASPPDFASRYAPDTRALLAKFEAEFRKNLEG